MQKRRPKKVIIQIAVAAVIAVVIGVGAVLGVLTVITNVQNTAAQSAKEAAEKAKVAEAELERIKTAQKNQLKVQHRQVQALADISPGEPITQGALALVDIDTPPGSGVLTRISDVVGKMATVPISTGEAITRTKVVDTSGFIQIKDGMRAMTIDVAPISSVEGALVAGSFVDILLTLDSPEPSQGLTKTLLQNVQVLSLNNSGGDKASLKSGNGITVAVTPKQAEILALAQARGKFHLTLRNFKDKTKVAVPGADMDALITGMDRNGTARPTPKPPQLPGQKGASPNANMVQVNNGERSLPQPGLPPEPAKQNYSMKIYKGSGTETVNFE